MRLLIGSELRKLLTRPIVFVLLTVFLIGIADITWTGQKFGREQWQASVNDYNMLHDQVRTFANCAGRSGQDLADCHRIALIEWHDAQSFLAWGKSIGAAGAASQHPLGAPGWVAGLLGSAPGIVAAFLLAAMAVAAEWEKGTATVLLLAERRLDRILLAKGIALWSLLMGMLAIGTLLVLGLDYWYFAHAYPLTELIPSNNALIWYSIRRVATAAVVTAVAVGLGVLAAARWRTRGAVISFGAVLAATAFLGAPWPVIWQWTPAGVVASLAHYTSNHGIWDHAWPAAVTHPAPLLLRAAVAATLVGGLGWWLRSGHPRRGLL
ncbi:hypothetical protein [Streptomyces sp. YGL11-2]|uniref:hypothetical protein n=1 Tax=Streptomyces sp. YGL11-2 TaxID=3414028 RepID=UPI003CF96AD0